MDERHEVSGETDGDEVFFFTFGVEGRREVLSRLVRGEKRPVLTEVGERVRQVWAGLHGIEESFTASEWVLMPDHAHLLLARVSIFEGKSHEFPKILLVGLHYTAVFMRR